MKAARQSHAHLGLESRAKKALKIAKLLNLPKCARPITLLEIGTGSGGIALYFATQADQKFDVHAVDVRDARVIAKGYKFTLVNGTELPYENHKFDVVISNHVIEHVGTEEDQLHHLQEIHRVLKADGIAYLAAPNRWMLVEPHYKLLFLSWLPRSRRSAYLRLMGKGDFYDCEPLELKRLESLLKTAGFEASNVCMQAIRALVEIEKPGSRCIRLVVTGILKIVPDFLLNILAPIIPTLMFTLRKK
jgi:ubiquinone/menaquinone biosynthesis C-methylase UbiE